MTDTTENTEAKPFRLTIIESPYAAKTIEALNRNIAYAKACLRDSLKRGEAPLASHLLYAQNGVLDDNSPEERDLGIGAGLAWGDVSHAVVVYTDLGISGGMQIGIDYARSQGRFIETRKLGADWDKNEADTQEIPIQDPELRVAGPVGPAGEMTVEGVPPSEACSICDDGFEPDGPVDKPHGHLAKPA